MTLEIGGIHGDSAPCTHYDPRGMTQTSASPANPWSESVLGLTPDGVVVCRDRKHPLHAAFAVCEAAALIGVGGHPCEPSADVSIRFWKTIADHFIRGLSQVPEGADPVGELSPPDPALLASWTLNAPPMHGAEYLSPTSLLALWGRLADWARAALEREESLASLLGKVAPAWSRVGRVTLHLAENRDDPDCPFAFMASYAAGLSQAGRLTQVPLGRALQEYSGAKNKAALLKLLTPLHAAARHCPLMAALIESGDVFHPLAWTPPEAYDFLRAIPAYEDAGLLVRLPNWWQKRGRRPKVTATIGEKKAGALGLDALLDFRLDVVIDGETLSAQEVERCCRARTDWCSSGASGSRWTAKNCSRRSTIGRRSRPRAVCRSSKACACSPARPGISRTRRTGEQREWAFAQPGAWLADTLRQLSPAGRPAPAGWSARHPAPVSGQGDGMALVLLPEPVSGHASPTTWAWARPSRCWPRCCANRRNCRRARPPSWSFPPR
jgi:hypothetical protein